MPGALLLVVKVALYGHVLDPVGHPVAGLVRKQPADDGHVPEGRVGELLLVLLEAVGRREDVLRAYDHSVAHVTVGEPDRHLVGVRHLGCLDASGICEFDSSWGGGGINLVNCTCLRGY